MDLFDTVQMFCFPGKGVTRNMVSVEWNKDYNMKHHPKLHQLIDKLWNENMEKSLKLFDASKFRLHQVEINQISNYSVPNIKVLCGLTSYKDFIGTNCAPFAEQLVKDGVEHYSDSQAFLANPIGVGGTLLTEDEHIVFMRRSEICAEMRGLLDRPGGHPEPDVLTSKFGQKMELIPPSEVVDEMFDSVLKEIRDEINIPIENLSDPVLLGISYNPSTKKRPSLEFHVRCNLSSKEVLDLYSKQTQLEKDESRELVFIPASFLQKQADSQKNLAFYQELTHPAQSGLFFMQTFLSE